MLDNGPRQVQPLPDTLKTNIILESNNDLNYWKSYLGSR